MELVNFLAELWGFSLVIIPLSFLINPKHTDKILEVMEKETSLILHGMIRVVLGVAMLLSYNVWDNSWKTIITILGWLLVISGVGLLYAPSVAAKMIVKMRDKNWIPFVLVVVILFGCFLVYMGFNA